MRRFRRGHDAFRARKLRAGLKHFCLVIRLGFDEAELQRVAHHRRHAVVTQPARVNRRRHEFVAERVHHQQRRRLRRVTEIVAQFALRQ